MAYQSVNPFNGEVLRTFDQHTDHQMEEMLVAAERTFHEVWSRKPVRDRAKVIGKAASLMLEQKGEVRAPCYSRNGKANRREPRRS